MTISNRIKSASWTAKIATLVLVFLLSIHFFQLNIYLSLYSPSDSYNISVATRKRLVNLKSSDTGSYSLLHYSADHYHNTLEFNYKEGDPFSESDLRARLAEAEHLYTDKREEDIPKLLVKSVFGPSSTNCPVSVGPVGQEGGDGEVDREAKWVCGFEEYTSHVRPQECVIYTFGGGASNSNFETSWLANSDCTVFKFQYEEQIMSKQNYMGSNRVETFPDVRIRTTETDDDDKDSERLKTLSRIMQENDHGWLDVLVLDTPEEIYSILKHLLQDFQREVLPFAQLIVTFPLEKSNIATFTDIFIDLQKRGLRPFHVSSLTDHLFLYSFFNARGRHLLLVGKEK